MVSFRGSGPMALANGVQIVPDRDDGAMPDVVCVPEVAVAPDAVLTESHRAEIDWLRRCHEGGAIIATACSGALLLAETGLLNGGEATTHWAYCDALACYPGVQVYPDRALVVGGEGGRLIMAGGGTSWEDLALYLVARLVSVDEAMHIAKLFLIDWHDVGQLPYAALARNRQVNDADIARCQSWIAEHYEGTSPVATMIQLSGLTERTFSRRFKQATGMSPIEYVHTLRLEEAKQLLESGDAPLEAIAEQVGYEDAAFFGRLFRRKVGVTPIQYRKRFQGLRRALEAT
ncbi:MAG: helix-turn-helix domain-containing protein [Pseudomonadales bacterium]|nr:helix-turn-helix domain-containing protein [Pseudomonadales bacterium]